MHLKLKGIIMYKRKKEGKTDKETGMPAFTSRFGTVSARFSRENPDTQTVFPTELGAFCTGCGDVWVTWFPHLELANVVVHGVLVTRWNRTQSNSIENNS